MAPGCVLLMFLLFSICPTVFTEILICFLYSFSTWQILENKKSLEKLKDVIAMNSSELSEVKRPVITVGRHYDILVLLRKKHLTCAGICQKK